MTRSFPPLADIIPHAAPMVLLDKILSHDNMQTQCAVTIHQESPFVDANGVSAIVTIEYMAQCIAVSVGLDAIHDGIKPYKGFLIGCREMQINRPHIPCGFELHVTSKSIVSTNDFSHFECQVFHREHLLVQASLSVARLTLEMESNNHDS